MKGYRFYAELPDSRGSKSGSKKWAPFTRRTLTNDADHGFHNNCIAVPLDDRGYLYWLHGMLMADCFAAVHGTSNSPVHGTSHSCDYLRIRCVRISAELARRLHPNLFAYLEKL